MNLEKQILSEHSKANTDLMAHYIGNDPARFKILMALFLLGKYRVSQRAAWVMSTCVDKHPDLIDPYFEKLISNLKRTENHPL